MISRRAQTVTVSAMAGIFIVSGGVSGVAFAEAHQYHLLSSTSACASRPAAATRVVSLVTTEAHAASSPSPRPSPSPAATSSPSPTASPKPSTSPKPTASPKPSTSPASANSPSPTARPSPTTPRKSPTPKPTPTPMPTSKRKTAKLCVFVEPFSRNTVQPGQTAGYEIWVWSTVTEAQGVTVTVALGSVAHVDAPRFTVCAKPSGDVCTVGTLPAGQSEELVAGSFVRRAASAGERITLTATVRGSKADSFHSAATINVVAASTPPPASPDPPLPTSTIPSGALPPLPSGAFTSPNGDPSGLFPTVAPSSSSSPSSAADHATKVLNRSNARDVSTTLPLDTRLIGGQLAGLAVLVTAIAIAIARLSLRGPRPHDGGDAAK
jgi:hypothetical protein